MRLPERSLEDCILDLAAPLLEEGGTPAAEDQARSAIALAIRVWNAHVEASELWGATDPRPLAALRKECTGRQAAPGLVNAFTLLSARWTKSFGFEARLVGKWSYRAGASGFPELECEMTFPEGVRAEVPPPAEQRVAIGGKFLDEVRIGQGTNSYLSYPVEHHRGETRPDGAVVISTQLATMVQLFAEGRMKPVGGEPVEVSVGGRNLGALVLVEVHGGGLGVFAGGQLVFRRPT